MAQILAPSTQWQMRVTKSSLHASPITSNTWSSLLMKQNKKTSSAKFRVLAVKSDNSTINRLEGLLNLDITPFTDKIIAEYIWYPFYSASEYHTSSNLRTNFPTSTSNTKKEGTFKDLIMFSVYNLRGIWN